MLSKLCCFSTDSCKGQCLGLSRNQNIKLTYTLIFLLLIIVTQVKNYTNKQTKSTDQTVQQYNCSDIQSIDQPDCIAQKKTTIDLFGLGIFHFVLFLLILPKTKHVKVINEGLWLIKVILLAGIVAAVGLTFGPSVSGLLQLASTIASPLLYTITNIVIIDNIYFLDLKLNFASEKYKSLHVVKVVLSVVFWVLAILLNVYSYYENELWVSISSSVLIGFFLAMTFLRFSKNNSLFVYALVMLHITLISFSIHSLQENEEKYSYIQHSYRIFILVATLLGMLSQGGNQIRTKKSTFNEILALNTSKKQEDNRYVSSNKWIVYHFIMVVIAFSFSPVFCYEYNATNETARGILDIGRVTWWVSGVVIYLWSLVVQKIYPEQDFSELENYFKEFELN